MSFLKKLIKKKDDEQKSPAGSTPAGMQAMSTELQLKYAKGVQYNMKVIIKGDRNVGKTTLLLRLQGQKFREEYLPTDEIQVANIQWNYKMTDDVVKVEVWDVVDKGRSKPSANSGLKMNHNGGDDDTTPKLDAQFVDVYKGTHAVIMMYDMTKLWTWQYIEREIHNVPSRIPIIILANNRDMGQHRTVDLDTTRYFVSSLDRGKGAAPVKFAESSLLNGFGLKFLHAYFNVPFLALQRETLQRQLDANTRETEAIQQELDVLGESDYDKVVEAGNKRRGAPNSTRPLVSGSSAQLLNRGNPSIPQIPLNNPGGKAKASQSVDDFAPDVSGDAFDFFGSDHRKPKSNQKKLPNTSTGADDDDEDDTDGNPMVATYEDFYSSDEEKPSAPSTIDTKPAVSGGGGKLASANVILSSDEEEEQEVKPESESDSDDHESAIDKLTKQFGHTVTASIASTRSAPQDTDSEEEEDEEGDSPVILTYTEELSDTDTPQAPSNSNKTESHSAGRTAHTLPSSKDVVLTDSGDDCDRPAVLETEQISSDEQTQVTPALHLPDIATSHQTAKDSDDEQHKPSTKKKKKHRKEKTTTADGEDEPKPRKKTKKSKKSEGESTKEKKKSKSKSKSEKPVLDPLEQFLAGGDDSQGQKGTNYECL